MAIYSKKRPCPVSTSVSSHNGNNFPIFVADSATAQGDEGYKLLYEGDQVRMKRDIRKHFILTFLYICAKKGQEHALNGK